MNLLSKFNSCDVKIREQFLMFEISWLKHFKFWFWVLVKFNWSTMLMTCNFYQKSGNLMCWFIRGIPYKAFALVQVISTPVSTFSTAQMDRQTDTQTTCKTNSSESGRIFVNYVFVPFHSLCEHPLLTHSIWFRKINSLCSEEKNSTHVFENFFQWNVKDVNFFYY